MAWACGDGLEDKRLSPAGWEPLAFVSGRELGARAGV